MEKESSYLPGNGFLPFSSRESLCSKNMGEATTNQLDFVYIIGDAYVDHPSFGHAIISRILEAHGFRVGIIAQPDWKDENSITVFGCPRLAFLISAGNMDSLVNHYSVSGNKRKTDAYSPGGEMGLRPDYATVVYSNLVRKVYHDSVPVMIGGIEASLRRMAHYDYWSNRLKRSILLDSQADLISYGMGEKSIIEIAEALDSGIDIKDITFIRGTVYKTKDTSSIFNPLWLPSYEELKESGDLIGRKYAESFYLQYQHTDPVWGQTLVEPYPNGVFVVQNPPQPPLTTEEMDGIYALPFMRTYHPSYEAKGGIPAIQEVRFSITSSRGCFGGCNFCALTFHQGRMVQSRSHESILEEAKLLTRDPEFKGYIHDVGGPTANFRKPSCDRQREYGLCRDRQCLSSSPCRDINIDHSDYLALLRKLRSLPGVKKVFVRSGIRFDYLLADPDDTFFQELVEHHISGQLKVAPEHTSDKVLRWMGKPRNETYRRFAEKYARLNRKLGKKQFLVPYLMSSHPGSTLKEAVELAEYLRDLGYMPEQVQDFYPTPSTISTVMYCTGIDPRSKKKIYICRSPHEKAMQRALIQYRNPRNYELVHEALTASNRMDLIGYDRKCLIHPQKGTTIIPVRKPVKKKKTIRNVHKKKNGREST